ncbi:MAG: hypothetical protein IPJ19_08165 [Planctomycetes bacterium]|nr:hypothetical protein [Planctomycetota bacterium]
MQRSSAHCGAIGRFVLVFAVLCGMRSTGFAHPQAQPTVYYVDPGSSGGTGLDWTTAKTTIEDAISVASDGDQIWVKEGTYLPIGPSGPFDGYLVSKGLSFYGGFLGNETNPWPNPPAPGGSFDATIIDGQTSSRCFSIIGASSIHRVEIRGFKIINGESSTSANGPALGGGVYCVNTELLLSDCKLVHNHGPVRGGGLYFSDLTGAGSWTLNIKRSTFDDNWVNEGKGGAIAGSFMNAGDIVNTVFSQNRVTVSGDGGAVYLEDMGANELRFTNCVFWRNSASGSSAKGGGICLEETSPSSFSDAKIVNCTFVMNVVTVLANGPALYCSPNSVCGLHNSILWGNTLGGGGSLFTPTFAGPVTVSWSDLEGYPPGTAPPTCLSEDPEFRSIAFAYGLTLRGTSNCLDHGNQLEIPNDFLDVNEDGLTIGQSVPIDLNGAGRDHDWPAAFDQGIPGGTFVDMGAFEKQ